MQTQEFLIYRLTNSSHEEVYAWLEANQPKKSESLLLADREELESALLLMDHPLVNLGLALHGYEQNTGYEIYQKADRTLKKAALSGPTIRISIGKNWIIKEGVLSDLLESKDSELLGALLSNPFLDDDLLVNLYEKTHQFKEIDDDFWQHLIAATLANPRLSTPYNSKWMDGWAEYSYSRVFTAGWKLFEKLPVNDDTALLLANLGGKLVSEAPNFKNINEIIKRWKREGVDKMMDYHSMCRTALAGLIKDFDAEFTKLKDNEDIALRKSYYRRFKPKDSGEIIELFEKDSDIFLEEALGNINLFEFSKTRDQLKKCCRDYMDPSHDMMFPNIYNARAAYFSQMHPEWFESSNGEIPVYQILDPLERANTQLEHVTKKILAISEKLNEPHDEDGQLLDELRNTLSNVAVYLNNLKNQSNFGWIWGLAGIAIGYLLAR